MPIRADPSTTTPTTTRVTPLPESFRDPGGFLYRRDGVLYRQIHARCREDYALLTESGLYAELAGSGLLVEHEEADLTLACDERACVVIRPRVVPFISYPYEWCFSQLKDAALATLEIQQRALARGMSLKDASAYNVQFLEGRPVHIDTLSFERYSEGRPWIAYRQFCQHFLAPLALMSKRDVGLGQLLRVHLDGVPLELASRLLPVRTRWSYSLGIHIHLHARSQRRHAADAAVPSARTGTMSRYRMVAWIDSLRSAVAKLDWQPGGTEWLDYYEKNNSYGEVGLEEKEREVTNFLSRIEPASVWDLGANTGRFTRLASARGATCVAWDVDPGCVEANYRMVKERRETRVLPLLQDLTNPSPGLGWEGSERNSLEQRGPADAILALGLIHHLAISNNVSLERIADFLARLAANLVIEWVPKQDPQVQKLLASREDVFPTYDRQHFEAAFARRFRLLEHAELAVAGRTLYRMQAS